MKLLVANVLVSILPALPSYVVCVVDDHVSDAFEDSDITLSCITLFDIDDWLDELVDVEPNDVFGGEMCRPSVLCANCESIMDDFNFKLSGRV